MNNQLVNELISILEQESRVYDDILRISKNKTNIIVEGKVSELENIVKVEQTLVLQMGRLESMRESLAEKLSAIINIKPSEITISELLKHLKDEQARALKNIQDKLNSTVKGLKGTNDLNSKLIKNSLDYINFSVNVLTNVDSGTNNYGNTGQIGDSKKRNLFDMKL